MNLEQPSWSRHLPTPAVLDLATLGPLGMKMAAPGTWGSLAGLLFFAFCFSPLAIIENLLASAVLAYLAIGICGEAEIRLGKRDPHEIILDEFVAMPLCFAGWKMIITPTPVAFLSLLLVGFALFRFYDIRKPLFINSLQKLPGGWGVVIDDTAAALATCATLHIAHLVWVYA